MKATKTYKPDPHTDKGAEYALTGLTRADIRWLYGCVLVSNWANYEDAAAILGQLQAVYGRLLGSEVDDDDKLATEFMDPGMAARLTNTTQ